MDNAAIMFENKFDNVAISASSSIILAPPAILQDPHVARKWRGRNGDTEALTTGYVDGFDTVMLRGLNLTAAGVTRLRVASADSSGQTGDVYDSGSAAGRVDPVHGNGTLIFCLPNVVSGYPRIDLHEPGAEWIEAGRLAGGQRHELSYSFGLKWTSQWADTSRETQSRGNQDYIDEGVSYRVWFLPLALITDTERREIVDVLDRANGKRRDFLFLKDPSSTRLGEDSIWGRQKDPSSIDQGETPEWSTKTLTIHERC